MPAPTPMGRQNGQHINSVRVTTLVVQAGRLCMPGIQVEGAVVVLSADGGQLVLSVAACPSQRKEGIHTRPHQTSRRLGSLDFVPARRNLGARNLLVHGTLDGESLPFRLRTTQHYIITLNLHPLRFPIPCRSSFVSSTLHITAHCRCTQHTRRKTMTTRPRSVPAPANKRDKRNF